MVDLDTDYPLLQNLDMNEIDMVPIVGLKSLSLRCAHSSSELVERVLTHTPELERLSFTVVKISERFTDCLSSHCPRLERLEIELTYSDSNRFNSIEILCRSLAKVYQGQLKHLKLCFHREPFVPQDVLNELWKNHGPHLESLELARFTISHGSLAYLAQHISPTLKRLCLSNVMEIRKPPLEVWDCLLARCGDSLQALHLDSNASFNDQIALIVAKNCRNLRELSLKRTWTGDLAVKRILETNGKTLRDLNLSKTSISGDTIREISRTCHRVVNLDVEWPRWTEASEETPLSAAEFAELLRVHGSHLESLNIDRWPINNMTLEAIAKYCRSLKVLTFRDNKTLSDEYLKKIMKSCKKLQRLYILLSYPYTVEGLTYDVLTEVQNRYIDYYAEVDSVSTIYR
ncbi:RNI-like protein [Basidiobolus meristosporus CBS 931.73]|uniref:RNI-like protein n=1 Tax=Basidiobolus meristosporus CBS 931.73 TaxID=1314790 RepID=A0A1Y1Z5T3_9FUNG|nr:RNI-like protein [Basidiobolus meristosporus CBS 931.73]|eukprot:ORY05610.1 RNI-like protein [Basidiobolus meristosporus CBS 931.73]